MIEREFKWLIRYPNFLSEEWAWSVKAAERIQQYYFVTGDREVRIRERDGRWKLGFKVINNFTSDDALVRREVEIETHWDAVKDLIGICDGFISKYRFVRDGFELDVFHGNLVGLQMVEYESEEGKPEIPTWLAPLILKEVTTDPRFKNQNLAVDGFPRDMLEYRII